MNKGYLTALALLAGLTMVVLATPAHAHGNKKHPATNAQTTQATQPIPEKSVAIPPADDHATDQTAHNSMPHEHSENPLAHDDNGQQEHEDEEEGHSHWGNNGPSTPVEKFLAYLGNFHALIVHFPIALFLTAALAQTLYLVRGKDGYADIVRFTVWIGALGALGAGLLGWAHAGPVPASESTLMMSHRWIGTFLLIGGIATALLMETSQRQKDARILALTFNIALFGMAAFVAINGFLGGALAHGGMKHLLPGMMG